MHKTIRASLAKRVSKLEKERGVQGIRPVAMFPVCVSIDEWGGLAARMQAVLKDNAKRDTAPDYGDLPTLELVASR